MAAKPEAAGTHVQDGIREMVRRIVKRFDPDEIILFGSHARGAAGPDSDVDLLIVMPVQGSRRQKQLEIRLALHDVGFAKNVIVTTPEDFAWRKEIPGTIERPAAREGKVLYARPRAHGVVRDSRSVGAEILEGIRELKRGEVGRAVAYPPVAETRARVRRPKTPR